MKKKLISLLLTFVMLVSLMPSALAAEPTFNDVAEDMWCFDYVEYVAEEGYFKGTTATTFEPNGTMTRQQFVTVLARMAGVKVDNSKTAFSDVPAGSYSAGSVAWAAKHGIVQGYADGTFKPTAPVTRQQMCAFMSRFMDYYADVHGAYFLKRPTVSTFADYDQVSDYAKTPVDRCRAYGLVQGYAEDNTFRPANTATRAHVAAVIYRLAQVLQFSSGGDGGKGTTYTLTYYNDNVPAGEPVETKDTKTVKAASHTFTVKADPAELNEKVFLGWTDGTDNFVAGDEITLYKAEPSKTINANWADKNDLLYQAIANTANYVMDKGQPKVDEANAVVAPYASLNAMSVATPSDIDANDGSRTITIGAEAELSTDIVSRMIETATYYAVKMIGSSEHFADSEVSSTDAISRADVEDIVAELLDVIDPNQAWWTGADRVEKVKNLASKIYDTLKAEAREHGGFLYNEYYKYNGAVLFTEVSLLDGDNVVVTAKNDKKLYDANDNQVSYKKGVALAARAVGKQLYASLQTNTEYVTDLCLTGELGLEFTMNSAQDIDDITKNYPNVYNVAVDLDLVQGGEEDFLAYKFDGGRNYVKLIVTTGLQADYEYSVNAIAEAAMTNGKLESELTKVMKDMLTDTIRDADASSSTDSIGKLLAKLMEYDAQIPGDQSTETKAEDYVLSKLLPAVDLWVAANLSTEKSPNGAPYYLPFDFFWNLGGTVNADGSLNVPTRAAAPVLGDNEDLVDAVELLIDEVVNSVAAPVYDEYDMDPADMEGSIKNLLNEKADEKLTPAKIADLQAQVIDAAADNFDTLKSTIQTEGTKLVKKAAMLDGMTEPQFNTYWDGLSSTQKADEIDEYLDVDEVLTDLFGTTDAAALTIDKIDAAAAYVPADYDEDVETKIKNVNTVAKLEALLDDFAEMVKDTTSETLYTVISEKVNGSMSDVAGSSAYVGDLLQVSYAETYVRELLLGKLGFTEAFNVDRLISGISLEERAIVNMAEKAEEIIDAEIEAERAALGLKAEDVENLLNDAVADACGTYSKYLNKVASFKTVKGMTDIQLNSLISVMENETVLNTLDGKVAPKYVEAVAKVVSKLDSVAGSNTSSITINGVTVDMSNDIIDDVKNADNAKELCKAVAKFLKPWGSLSVNSFAPEAGIPVDVVASARGVTYDFGVNFVIEVK